MCYSVIFVLTLAFTALANLCEDENLQQPHPFTLTETKRVIVTITAPTRHNQASSTSSGMSVIASTVPNLTRTDPVAQPSSSLVRHSPGAKQAFLSAGPDYQAAVLYHHNAARANHNAAPLVWDTVCETNARQAAERCKLDHYIPTGAGQGQNIFATPGEAYNVTAGITESWYKDELGPMAPFFGQNSISDNVFYSVGHLTQIVWKGTTMVGCVSIDCGRGPISKLTVCNYAPAGNIPGGYARNVLAPISTVDLGSWAD
ncbi:CAP domain-containing protein [Phaeosphaeriaceae sp. PMI808]|nr:CAP domain-containing protein [Phaeosphaeriaceae sp. PMI808]